MPNNQSPLPALMMSHFMAKSEHLDSKQTSRAMIAALVLRNPLLTALMVRSLGKKEGSVVQSTKAS